MPKRVSRKIFDRPLHGSHGLRLTLEDACRKTNGLELAVLNNLALDHRVSCEREKSFVDFCLVRLSRGAMSVFDLLKAYERREVQLRGAPPAEMPAYLRRENSSNLLHGDLDFQRELLDPATRLVTVKTARDIHDKLRPRVSALVGSDRVDPMNPTSLIDAFFDAVPFGQQGRLLEESLGDALNERRGAASIPQPDAGCVWATLKVDLDQHLSEDPEHWFEFLGLKKYRGEGIAFVVSYRVSDTGGLARPTQIDAGDYAPHMPPPPASDVGARTLPWGRLCGSSGAREMLLHQEVVARQRLKVIRWARYKFESDGPTPEQLYRARALRLRQWGRIDTRHRDLVRKWLKN